MYDVKIEMYGEVREFECDDYTIDVYEGLSLFLLPDKTRFLVNKEAIRSMTIVPKKES